METHIEDVPNGVDSTAVSRQEEENAYRLPGAHQRLYAAIIAFAQRAPAIDWPRLREAHF
jgi:hypothetical protein